MIFVPPRFFKDAGCVHASMEQTPLHTPRVSLNYHKYKARVWNMNLLPSYYIEHNLLRECIMFNLSLSTYLEYKSLMDTPSVQRHQRLSRGVFVREEFSQNYAQCCAHKSRDCRIRTANSIISSSSITRRGFGGGNRRTPPKSVLPDVYE